MTFTALGKNDIDLILAIQKDNFADGWNASQLLSGFESGNLIAIALQDGGKTVGLITYTLVIDTADIEGVVVLSSERKKGYGKELVERALLELKASGAVNALLEVRESNAPAIALYRSCGFKSIATRAKYYSDGESAVVMKKELL